MTVKEQEQYICNRLREERKSKKLSQLELSYVSGVSQNMITYIETGKRRVGNPICSVFKHNSKTLRRTKNRAGVDFSNNASGRQRKRQKDCFGID